MRNTVHGIMEDADSYAILKSIEAMVARIQQYVPGYRLRAKPLIQDEGGKKRVTVFVEVEGPAIFCPSTAGNLDIMTSSSVKVGEEIARHLNAGLGQNRRRRCERQTIYTYSRQLLRDGSHALSHQYTAAQVSAVARGLDDAGVEIIEVSHGDGLGGSTVTYGFSKQSEMELIQAAAEVIKKASWRFYYCQASVPKTISRWPRTTAPRWRRSPPTLPESDVAEQHIGLAKSMGMEVIGMLMCRIWPRRRRLPSKAS